MNLWMNPFSERKSVDSDTMMKFTGLHCERISEKKKRKKRKEEGGSHAFMKPSFCVKEGCSSIFLFLNFYFIRFKILHYTCNTKKHTYIYTCG